MYNEHRKLQLTLPKTIDELQETVLLLFSSLQFFNYTNDLDSHVNMLNIIIQETMNSLT